MSRLIQLIFVLIQYGQFSEANSPVINIYYSQDTQCSNGLIAKLDNFHISSNVSFPHASKDWGTLMRLYLVSDTQCFEYFVSLSSGHAFNLPNSSPDGSSHGSPDGSLHIQCSSDNVHGHTFYPRCTVQANVLLSNAVAFGKVSNKQGHHRFSNNITMPLMYNMSAVRLHVNEKFMSRDTVHDQCTFYINREKPAIRACCEHAPSPCMVKIYNKGNEVANGEQCVYVDGPSVKSSNYTFSFTFCGKPETTESYICQALFDSGFPVAVNIFLVTTASLISFIMK